METPPFEEVDAQMRNSQVQHYTPSLHGNVSPGEAVLLVEEVQLTVDLRSKVATIVRKETPSGFLLNYFVFPRGNGIEVPRLPVPRQRTYLGYPFEEVLQTRYVSVLPEDGLHRLAYLIKEEEILSGRSAFCVGMSDCFFLRFRIDTDRLLQPIKGYSKPNCRSLTQQTWSICRKIHRVIMEAMNSHSLSSTYMRHKTIDFAEWEWLFFWSNLPIHHWKKRVL